MITYKINIMQYFNTYYYYNSTDMQINYNGSFKVHNYTIIVIIVFINYLLHSLHPRVRKRNFPCNDDNVAFMQQVHSKTTGKRSVLLIV